MRDEWRRDEPTWEAVESVKSAGVVLKSTEPRRILASQVPSHPERTAVNHIMEVVFMLIWETEIALLWFSIE